MRNAEERVKELAEEKVKLQEQFSDTNESIDKIFKDSNMQKRVIREEMHNIEVLSIDLNKLRKDLDAFSKENSQLFSDNESISKNIPELKEKIENLKQKIQLNEILKEVDLDELKMLKQNNMEVNSAITNLVARWEALEAQG